MVRMEPILFFSKLPSLDSVLFGAKIAYAYLPLVHFDIRTPFLRYLAPRYPDKPRSVVAWSLGILGIFGGRNIPQIFNSIIRFDAVYVVDMASWPLAVMQQPANPVSLIFSVIYGAHSVPIGMGS